MVGTHQVAPTGKAKNPLRPGGFLVGGCTIQIKPNLYANILRSAHRSINRAHLFHL